MKFMDRQAQTNNIGLGLSVHIFHIWSPHQNISDQYSFVQIEYAPTVFKIGSRINVHHLCTFKSSLSLYSLSFDS